MYVHDYIAVSIWHVVMFVMYGLADVPLRCHVHMALELEATAAASLATSPLTAVWSAV